jgi:hypothetical protein
MLLSAKLHHIVQHIYSKVSQLTAQFAAIMSYDSSFPVAN